MEIVPAIDISDGKCVRLIKGQKGTERVYYESPIDALTFWMEKKAKRVHIIDLNGAWGEIKNQALLRELLNTSLGNVKVQVGGGIRSLGYASEFLKLGFDRIILGTLAFKEPETVRKLIKLFGNERIIVAIDYIRDKLAIEGWLGKTNIDIFPFTEQMINCGVRYVLLSSIELDGTLSGPDFETITEVSLQFPNLLVYAAGGISDIRELSDLKALGVHGVVIGKAFYENLIPLDIVNKEF